MKKKKKKGEEEDEEDACKTSHLSEETFRKISKKHVASRLIKFKTKKKTGAKRSLPGEAGKTSKQDISKKKWKRKLIYYVVAITF